MRLTFWTALIFCSLSTIAQPDTITYWIQFTDKDHNNYSLTKPEEFLSARAIKRREVQQIPYQQNDLPVSSFYIDSLKRMGVVVGNRSKWLNAVAGTVADSVMLQKVNQLSFVKTTRKAGRWSIQPQQLGLLAPEVSKDNAMQNEYGESFNQIEMVAGNQIHQLGYRGEGMLIAVLDAGFTGVDYLPAFDNLRQEGRILGTRDFVDGGSFVYHAHTHGMYVLSVMAGYLPGYLIGTSPDASFWLMRSEQGASELIIEEDNWIAAAELADSVGADIINSSLGYSTFDDTTMNHTYADMDGNTTPISRAADIAASKGILVVNSAGNEGNSPWKHILAPSDGDSVLAVGAVDSTGAYASFSSLGPSSDGQVKPNIAAQGQQLVVTSFIEPYIQRGSGTSFSSPLIAGMSASLWQAFPGKTNMEIIDALHKSAHQYLNPDEKLGYGIPNFANAFYLLSGSPFDPVATDSEPIVYPNPTSGEAYLFYFSQFDAEMEVDLYNSLGQLAGQQTFSLKAQTKHTLKLHILKNLPPGVYVAAITLPWNTFTIKISKS